MGRRVHIRFTPDDARDRALLRGEVTATVRPAPMGEVGDDFSVYHLGLQCRITRVSSMTLKDLADGYWKQMGYASPAAVLRHWAELHPRLGGHLQRTVWVHEFVSFVPRKVLIAAQPSTLLRESACLVEKEVRHGQAV